MDNIKIDVLLNRESLSSNIKSYLDNSITQLLIDFKSQVYECTKTTSQQEQNKLHINCSTTVTEQYCNNQLYSNKVELDFGIGIDIVVIKNCFFMNSVDISSLGSHSTIVFENCYFHTMFCVNNTCLKSIKIANCWFNGNVVFEKVSVVDGYFFFTDNNLLNINDIAKSSFTINYLNAKEATIDLINSNLLFENSHIKESFKLRVISLYDHHNFELINLKHDTNYTVFKGVDILLQNECSNITNNPTSTLHTFHTMNFVKQAAKMNDSYSEHYFQMTYHHMKATNNFSRNADFIYGNVFKYFTSPKRVFQLMVFAIILFTLLYLLFPNKINYQGNPFGNKSTFEIVCPRLIDGTLFEYLSINKELILSFISSTLYFSLISFLTIGYGDIVATNGLRHLAAIEGFVGVCFVAFLTATILRRMNID